MPLFLHPSNLVIPKVILAEKYTGGIEQFKIDFKYNSSLYNQEDEALISICAINKEDFNLELLITKGLQFSAENNDSEDFVIINRHGGAQWFFPEVYCTAAYICYEKTDYKHSNLVQEIENLTLTRLDLFCQFSEAAQLTVSNLTYNVLKLELDKPYILIERKLQNKYDEAVESNLTFEIYMATHPGNKVEESLPLCFIPEMDEKVSAAYLFADERPNFKPNNEYEEQKSACKKALALLSQSSTSYNINRENLTQFLHGFEALYFQLFTKWNFKVFVEFRDLFSNAINWIEYFKIAEKAQTALQKLNKYNEDDIEDWLIDYNRLFYCNSAFWGSFFDLVDEETHLYKMHGHKNIYLLGHEITDCIEFGKEFNHYTKLYATN